MSMEQPQTRRLIPYVAFELIRKTIMTERPPLVASRAAVPSPSRPNLGTPERAVSLLAGTLLIANGLRQGGLRGWPQVLLGACAAWRAYSGSCRV
jgi:hypothetical protein